MLGAGELEEILFLIIYRLNDNNRAFPAIQQGAVLVPLNDSSLGRNGMAMRVMSRFAQKFVQPLQYLFRNRMLQLLRGGVGACLLYTSPSPRDATLSRMPSSA